MSISEIADRRNRRMSISEIADYKQSDQYQRDRIEEIRRKQEEDRLAEERRLARIGTEIVTEKPQEEKPWYMKSPAEVILKTETPGEAARKVGGAVVGGAGDVVTGLTSTLRTIDKPLSYLGAKLESAVTGKDIDPSQTATQRFLTERLKEMEKTQEQYAPDPEAGLAERVILGGVRSIPQVLPALTGATAPQSLGLIGATSFGGGAREAEKAGATELEQVTAGVGTALAEVATEYLPTQKLAKFVGGKGTVKDLAIQMLEELVGESASEALSPAIATVYDQNALNEAYVQNLDRTLAQIGEAGLTGAVASVLTGGSVLGLQSVSNAISNPTPENLSQVVEDMEATTGKALPEDVKQKIITEETNINKLSANEIKQELTSRGLDATGTASEVRNRLKSALQSETQQIVQPEAQVAETDVKTISQKAEQVRTQPAEIEGAEPTQTLSQIADKVTPESIVAQKPTIEQRLESKEVQVIERELLIQAKTVIDNITTENLDSSVKQLNEIKRQADKHGIPMNLQLFSKTMEDIAILEEVPTVQKSLLKTYSKALNEFNEKGITKATRKQFERLVNAKESINELKQKHKEEIKALKETQADRMKAKIQATREIEQQKALFAKEKQLERLNKTIDKYKAKVQATKEVEQQRALIKLEKTRDRLKAQIQAQKEIGQQKVLFEKEKGAERLKEQKEKFKAREEKRKLSANATRALKKLRKAKNLMPEAQAIFDKLGLADIDTVAKSMSDRKQLELTELRNEIDKQVELGVEIPDSVQRLVSRLDKQQIGSMTNEQVNELIEAVEEVLSVNKEIVKQNREAEAAIVKEGVEAIKETTQFEEGGKAKDVNKVISAVNPLFGRGRLTMKTNFLNLAGSQWDTGNVYKVFQDLRNAQNQEFHIKQELNKLLSDSVGKTKKLIESKAWNKKEQFGAHKLSAGERLWLKAASRDTDALRDLEEIGYARQNETDFKPITKEEIDALPVREGEQALLESLYKVFDRSYDLANEAYMKKNGKPLKKTEGDYFHLNVHPASMTKDMIDKRESKVFGDVSQTMLREKATKGLMMEDILVYADSFINDTAKYNAYVNSLKRFADIMGNPEVRSGIKQRFGVDSKGNNALLTSIDNKINDIQKRQEKRTDLSENQLRKIHGNIIKSILSYRSTTPMIQPGSYFMAASTLSPKAMTKALVKVPNIKEMIDNVPRAYERTVESFDRDIIKSADTAGGSVKKFVDNLINAGLAPIKATDMLTVGALWEASKIDAKGDMTKARKLFENALDSQPNFTQLERSDVMGSKGMLTKTMTMFGSARNAAYNELVQGVMKAKQTGNYDKLGKSFAGYAMSHLFIAAVRSGIANLKGDEPEFWKKFLLSFFSGLPGLDSLIPMVQGFDLDSPTLNAFNEINSAVQRAYKMSQNMDDYTNNEILDAGLKLADSMTALRGVGFRNMRESLELISSIFTGGSRSKPSIALKGILDPYKKTYSKEFYDDIKIAAKKEDTEGITNLLQAMDGIGIKRSNLRDKLKDFVEDEELTKEEASDVIKLLPKIRK